MGWKLPPGARRSDRDVRDASGGALTSCNSLNSLLDRGLRAMATLLLWTLCATLSGGCLAFEDYPVLSDLPPPKNQKIRCVKLENPADAQATVQVGASCHFEFSAFFEDLDLTDSIRSRWIVDNDTAHPNPGNIVDPGQAGRRVTSPPGVVSTLTGLSNGQYHLVTVLATDTDFSTSVVGNNVILTPYDKPPVTLSDGTVVTVPGSSSFCQWFVKVEVCP